jgi:uncharacterized protein YbjQ (UPF0145 family)
MGAIQLECSECFRTVSVDASGQKCVCGAVFVVSDPSVFENPFFGKLAEGKSSGIIISTETQLDGFKILARFGIVSSEYVAGVNAFREALFVGLTDTFGGRSGTLQAELKTMKNACIRDLKSQAFELGANAVIAVDFKYANLSGHNKFMMLLAATGTAVTLQAPGEQNSDGQVP